MIDWRAFIGGLALGALAGPARHPRPDSPQGLSDRDPQS
jgi:hypothetical protein